MHVVSWNVCGLGNGWTKATSRSGPHFTRQKKVGDSFDQARLDRVHFARDEQWTDKRIQMVHDEVPDHHPVRLAITKHKRIDRHPSTYFKVCPRLLEKPEIQEGKKLEAAGLQFADPRVKWELKWQAVRTFLRSKQKEARA
ncbi:hypothetical protein R1sor_021203 [Riccia sorocarpa]|uniref:Endonuclease/exonuclease/phosphatase domain-containing protein n=1 Tax=Riccia sorocarpa TaxID=122646 RepID=A0ABD3GJA3_9MARC